MQVLVDTGPSNNILNVKTFKTINEISGNTIVLDKSDTIIEAYGNDNLFWKCWKI